MLDIRTVPVEARVTPGEAGEVCASDGDGEQKRQREASPLHEIIILEPPLYGFAFHATLPAS